MNIPNWHVQIFLREQRRRINDAFYEYESVYNPWSDALDIAVARQKGEALIRALDRAITKIQGGVKGRKVAENRRQKKKFQSNA